MVNLEKVVDFGIIVCALSFIIFLFACLIGNGILLVSISIIAFVGVCMIILPIVFEYMVNLIKER